MRTYVLEISEYGKTYIICFLCGNVSFNIEYVKLKYCEWCKICHGNLIVKKPKMEKTIEISREDYMRLQLALEIANEILSKLKSQLEPRDQINTDYVKTIITDVFYGEI